MNEPLVRVDDWRFHRRRFWAVTAFEGAVIAFALAAETFIYTRFAAVEDVTLFFALVVLIIPLILLGIWLWLPRGGR